MPNRQGFTIIEVMLFFGISSFLIVGLMVGTSATIARHRYNDSVQDLAEFFRREYSTVVNPENSRNTTITDNVICPEELVAGTDADDGAHRGRSGCLIYGRLIVIGETDSNTIYSYDVIGKQVDNPLLSLGAALKEASISVIAHTDSSRPTLCFPVGQLTYSMQWLARAETTDPTPAPNARASILILRSPTNGTVNTLYYQGVINVQNASGRSCGAGELLANDIIDEFIATNIDVDLCIGSDDVFALSGRRRNVRIARGGRNGSAVKIVEDDNVFDPSDPTSDPEGNRCQS